MKKIYPKLALIILLCLVNVTSGSTQNLFKFLELHGGGQGGNLSLSEKKAYYAKTDSAYSGYLSLHAHLVSVFPLKKNPYIQFRVGAGIRSEIIYLFPLLPVNETGFSNREDLTVFEVHSWNNQLTIPMSMAFEIYITRKAGFKLSVGVDHRFVVHRTRPKVYLVENYNEELRGGYSYYSEPLNNALSDHYADAFRRYTITGNIGIGIIEYGKQRATIGFKTNHFLLSPFKAKGTIQKHGGLEFFLELPFW